MSLISIVNLWYETQMGNIHKCREKQIEFSQKMWDLYEELNNQEQQTTGDEVIWKERAWVITIQQI